MASGLAINALAGMGKQSSFGTGIVASQWLPLLSENIKADSDLQKSEFRQGSAAVDFLGLGPIKCGGPLAEQLRYLTSTETAAHILMEQVFGKAVGHVYREIKRTGYIPLRIAATDNQELADQFTCPGAGSRTVTEVWIWYKRDGAPSGNLTVELQTDSAGSPSGTPVTNGTSNTVNVASVPADGDWIKFTFAVNPALTGGTIYHIVRKGTYTASATDRVQVGVNNVGSAGSFEIKDVSYADDATNNGLARVITTTFFDSFLMANSIEGLFASIAVDKGVNVHEFVGMKARELTLKSTPADGLRALYDLVGYDEKQTGQASSASVLAGLKVSNASWALHKDLSVCWVGDQVDALQASDNLSIDSFEYKQSRPLDQQPISGARQILEPVEDGTRKVTIKIKLPRYAADTWRTWQNAGTPLQGKFQWTLSGKYWTLLVPNMIIDGAVEIQTGAAAAYSQDVMLTCFRNGSTNGFIGTNDEAELNCLA